MLTFLATSACLLNAVLSQRTLTAYVYADNYFEFYFNGNKVATDPVSYVPHNGVAFTFEAPSSGTYTYAFLAKDYSDSQGLEVNSKDGAICVGDGGIIVRISDGTVTSANWKCKVINYGPTNLETCYSPSTPKCLPTGDTPLGVCNLTITSEPTNWYGTTFDDSSWTAATEYTETEIGWGKAPTPGDANYGGCIDPRDLSFGSASFIWGDNLLLDNTILCRYSYTATGSETIDTSMSVPTTTGSCSDCNGEYCYANSTTGSDTSNANKQQFVTFYHWLFCILFSIVTITAIN